MNNYQIYSEVGRGRSSVVYKGRRKQTLSYFAIKSVDKKSRSKDSVHHEVRFLHGFRSPNVMRFHEWYETSNHIWLILEFCGSKDLETMIRQDPLYSVDSVVRTIAEDLCRGLHYVHSQGVLYCDLKPSNVLLDGVGTAKLFDFLLACKIVDVGKMVTEKRGTPAYMAPECFADDGVFSMRSDLWSLGCLLFELATGKPAFSGETFEALLTRIAHDEVAGMDGLREEHPVFASLLDGLLDKDPLRRFGWSEVFDHPFWGMQGEMWEKERSVKLPKETAFDAFVTRRAQIAGSVDSSSGKSERLAEAEMDVQEEGEAGKKEGRDESGGVDGSGRQDKSVGMAVHKRSFASRGKRKASSSFDVVKMSALLERNARRQAAENDEEEEEEDDGVDDDDDDDDDDEIRGSEMEGEIRSCGARKKKSIKPRLGDTKTPQLVVVEPNSESLGAPTSGSRDGKDVDTREKKKKKKKKEKEKEKERVCFLN
eukprot:TRINITY_DN1347_c0_g1_i6.p1 TRINITY_DN1347_c0_g1~~TRINITY_DN1347_c0_g1_i6.p1  ORF type:complete len:482 (+),score=163.47 TRINITY_DN1347_c0_g1_i6:88-1533(+)